MIWCLFPSGNSEQAQRCAAAWKSVGWKVAVLIDADQPDVRCDLLVREENYRGTGAAFNKLMDLIPDAEIFACINDDMFPMRCPASDAERIYREMFPNLDGVLQPTGCWFDAMAWCAPSPIIGRSIRWHEGYYHLHCDEELRIVATRRGAYIETDELAIDHRHKSLGYADTLPPEKRARNNTRHAADRLLYETRKAAGFP